MNVLDFQLCKARSEKIVMLTCYDYTSARIVQDSGIDVILVGDSAAMVMHGYGTTIPADIEMMCRHIESVSRGTKNKFIVGDMPFLSFRLSRTDNMRAVASVMKSGAHAVKLEGIEGKLHRACWPDYLTEEVTSTMTAVHIWVTAWLISSQVQELAKKPVVSGEYLFLSG